MLLRFCIRTSERENREEESRQVVEIKSTEIL